MKIFFARTAELRQSEYLRGLFQAALLWDTSMHSSSSLPTCSPVGPNWCCWLWRYQFTVDSSMDKFGPRNGQSVPLVVGLLSGDCCRHSSSSRATACFCRSGFAFRAQPQDHTFSILPRTRQFAAPLSGDPQPFLTHDPKVVCGPPSLLLPCALAPSGSAHEKSETASPTNKVVNSPCLDGVLR